VAAAAVPVLGIYGSVHPWPTGVRRDGLLLTLAAALAIAAWFAIVLRYRAGAIPGAGGHTRVSPSAGITRSHADGESRLPST